jgi:hypothetical protein
MKYANKTLSRNSLFWCATTFLSVYTIKYYEMNTALPGYDGVAARRNRPMDAAAIDPDKEAFSTAPHDEESAYAPLGMSDHHDDAHGSADPYGAPSPYGGSHLHGDLYGGATVSQGGSGYGSSGGLGENPFRQDNPFESDSDVGGYHSVQGSTVNSRYNAPAAHDEYDDRPAAFPTANYDRIER